MIVLYAIGHRAPPEQGCERSCPRLQLGASIAVIGMTLVMLC
jgi:hypothetical protein